MGYVTLNAYDADVRIPQFLGINQYGEEHGSNPCYASEMVNGYVKEGCLQPMAACMVQRAATPAPMETLALLHRRWYAPDEEHDILIAGAGGKLYWKYPDGASWTELPFPEGVEGYQCNEWSTVGYEINEGTSVLTAEDPIDVLLLSNAKDGMVCVRADNMTVTAVPTPKRFGVIERHAERIWGGAIEDDPDMLVYSAPYDPFNWEEDPTIPEDGAGDIQQPGWDGDRFTALKTFGTQLIAFKRTRVWRILGTNPGEYTFYEQYGGGTAYEKTVAVNNTVIYMLGRNGLLAYNGETVSDYKQDYVGRIWERMNRDALDQACGCMFGRTYYLALPLDRSSVNNAVLMYDTANGIFLLREGVSVERFLPTEDKLYFTSSQTPGKYWLWQEDVYNENQWAEPMKWVGPWMDFNYKSKTKGSFTLYVTVDCEDEKAIDFSIQTEKKTKTKTVTFSPAEYGKECKQRRLSFGGTGRRFRLIIEANGGERWRIAGGIGLTVETDDD